MITEVDVMPPVPQHLRSNSVESDHDLQIARAVTQRCEAELAAVATEDDPSRNRHLATRTRVRRDLTCLRSNLRQRVSPREGYRIWIDALLPQPLQLLPAYPNLFRQPFQ